MLNIRLVLWISVIITIFLLTCIGCAAEPVTKATPTPSQSASDISPAPFIPGPFESVLQGDDLTKFQGLTDVVKQALEREAHLRGNDNALYKLRTLPADVQPLDVLVSERAVQRFAELDEEHRLFVLLHGYTDAFIGKDPENPTRNIPETPAAFLEDLIDTLYGKDTTDGVVLVPFDEAAMLSDAAKAKLASMDPLLQRAFRMIWARMDIDQAKLTETISGIEAKVMAAPVGLPSIESLVPVSAGLESALIVPNFETFVKEYIAGEIAFSGELSSQDIELIGRYIEVINTPGAADVFTRGFMPGYAGIPLPLASGISGVFAYRGFWPLWVVPEYFRDMQPDELLARVPTPYEVLTSDVLSTLDSLDAPLRREFYTYWNSQQTPVIVSDAASNARRNESHLRCIPLTTMPAIEELLSPEALAVYESLEESRQDLFRRQMAQAIVQGKSSRNPSKAKQFGLEMKYACNGSFASRTPPEEFLAALRAWAEKEVLTYLPAITPTPVADEAARQALDPEKVLEGEDLETWQALNADHRAAVLQGIIPQIVEEYKDSPDMQIKVLSMLVHNMLGIQKQREAEAVARGPETPTPTRVPDRKPNAASLALAKACADSSFGSVETVVETLQVQGNDAKHGIITVHADNQDRFYILETNDKGLYQETIVTAIETFTRKSPTGAWTRRIGGNLDFNQYNDVLYGAEQYCNQDTLMDIKSDGDEFVDGKYRMYITAKKDMVAQANIYWPNGDTNNPARVQFLAGEWRFEYWIDKETGRLIRVRDLSYFPLKAGLLPTRYDYIIKYSDFDVPVVIKPPEDFVDAGQ